MNKVITVGREFGSGGRELGKRLAEKLGIAYYDQEILTQIAQRTQLAEGYVRRVIEHQTPVLFPITIGRSIAPASQPMLEQSYKIFQEQHAIITEMAQASDCVIVGRCGDYILRDMKPLRLFIYAEMEHRLARCRDRAPEGENLTDRELRQKIRQVDRNRSKYYQFFTGQKWGDRANYDLCINTSQLGVKEAVEMLINAPWTSREEGK